MKTQIALECCVCTVWFAYTFDTLSAAKERLAELEADKSRKVSQVRFIERIDARRVKYGFTVERMDGSFYRYEYHDIDETRKLWKAANRRKKNRSVSDFYIARPIAV